MKNSFPPHLISFHFVTLVGSPCLYHLQEAKCICMCNNCVKCLHLQSSLSINLECVHDMLIQLYKQGASLLYINIMGFYHIQSIEVL